MGSTQFSVHTKVTVSSGSNKRVLQLKTTANLSRFLFDEKTHALLQRPVVERTSFAETEGCACYCEKPSCAPRTSKVVQMESSEPCRK